MSKQSLRKPNPKNEQPGESPSSTTSLPLLNRLNPWLAQRQNWVLGALIVFWLLLRIFFVAPMANGPLFQLNRWEETDNYFFDEWAQSLAAGNWLNNEPLHPYHGWHQSFADQYFKQHPDKLNQILAAHPGRDSSFVPGKTLWNEWYGGNTYHQEPLYAYLLAFLYALTGNGAYWMILLQALVGIGSGVLLWFIAKRYFDHSTALLTGVLYGFCGILMLQEGLLLRTSWSVFFALLLVWSFQSALDQRTNRAFLLSGVTMGLAFLLQSYFILFLVGALVLYFLETRNPSKPVLRHVGLMFAGWLMLFLPIVGRNAAVGAPLFSTSSIGSVTFVATNVKGTNAVSRWQPEAAKCAEIMGGTQGKFVPAVSQTLGTHSVGSYLQLLGAKLGAVVNGHEWPNNENFYFYRECIPVLKTTFVNFYWIAFLGVAGLTFSLYQRKKPHRVLYLAILIQLAILLGFYVLGRLRAPMAALMLPFAAFALVECLGSTTTKSFFGQLGVIALYALLFVFPSYNKPLPKLDVTDYNTLYEMVYFNRIKSNAEAQKWSESIAAHDEFMRYEPDFIKKLTPGRRLQNANEVELVKYFSNQYNIRGYLYEDSGNANMAAKAKSRNAALTKMAEDAQKQLMKPR